MDYIWECSKAFENISIWVRWNGTHSNMISFDLNIVKSPKSIPLRIASRVATALKVSRTDYLQENQKQIYQINRPDHQIMWRLSIVNSRNCWSERSVSKNARVDSDGTQNCSGFSWCPSQYVGAYDGVAEEFDPRPCLLNLSANLQNDTTKT